MRRLFSVLLCLVMLFGIMPTAHAANDLGVTFTATLDKDTIAPSDEAQTVVMTVKANKEFDIDAIGMIADSPKVGQLLPLKMRSLVLPLPMSTLKKDARTMLHLMQKTGRQIW